MLAVKREGILLEPTSFEFENEGVLNPAAIREGEYVHIFYRAVRNGNYSTIGYCKLKGPLTIEERHEKPLISPTFEYEAHGIEDPRIVKIEELYYLTYTAYDGINALGALAVSKDLQHFNKWGIIVPKITYEDFSALAEQKSPLNEKYSHYNSPHTRFFEIGSKKRWVWDKNVMFFPRRINGKLYLLHRIRPDIQIVVAFAHLAELTADFWNNYFLHLDQHIVLSPKYDHEISYIGGGCPPIETKEGWLLIYHGVTTNEKGNIYSACAALLDLEDVSKEIASLPYPLFSPEKEWELFGDVDNVCFPTGAVVFDDILYIYYGAADKRIAVASVSLSALLTELLLHPT